MVPFLTSVAVLSISGVMMPGPMFAVTVARSYSSPMAGAKIALGHALVEVPLMLAIYFGLGRFLDNEPVQLALYLVGGALLVWMGVSLYRKSREPIAEGGILKYNAVASGALTSAANPFFFLWWAAVGGMLVMQSLAFGITGFILLVVIHSMCDFGWLVMVSNVVYRTQNKWRDKFRVGLLVACSFLLMGFGGWFVASGIRLLA